MPIPSRFGERRTALGTHAPTQIFASFRFSMTSVNFPDQDMFALDTPVPSRRYDVEGPGG